MLIGLTGPSTFTADCVRMVEEVFKSDFVLLYHNKEELLRDWVKRCDAVILTGGTDLHPSTYGGRMLKDKGFDKFDLARDRRELVVLGEAERLGRPVMGICRGHQLIGARAGFKFIPDLVGPVPHSPSAEGISLKQDEPAHHMKVVSRRGFGPLAPAEEVWVNSFHHQGLRAPEKGQDVEGVEVVGVTGAVVELMRGERFVSTQFHPEFDYKYNRVSRAALSCFGAMFGVTTAF